MFIKILFDKTVQKRSIFKAAYLVQMETNFFETFSINVLECF